ncbi:hypothetical protein BJV85_003792 [Clostridium acetobutylicum]|uniref:Glycogen-binding regulatory subunit of S/T protein phosphatase I n=1 Tax=Clostridium acetobutylicum (strain ATCC 824 / DSM 792 / JCM 1419 / IAM 19013 / LMG 5710 / NBRC 13948 / NRRL B-527 / VKM B-1787 / 2291 / W) TaxID=272562 RepID=Q97TH2_CLOAB|nr:MULTISPECIES: carbohydrate-binding protein [Clostridium]AAK76874.1 Glycogen-binding regulatory subunit of S/T protein phosphatase I [Clostridium acetobutylicum ATCC 824]ADZ22911.1 Glycogen-binding regulatory subunit of S/T protein phosphatase I [Clostridium acetobutylicum EA 2018]AEI34870.1 glycogen-binding regulatory subunit of S/T protein phosphatase I [Clostridium acetobutylicum DSM 1731]AWV82416.1 glycogen-binding protein [Clostridium acetobutylicum]MBC2395740.1 glycogen-binding protein
MKLNKSAGKIITLIAFVAAFFIINIGVVPNAKADTNPIQLYYSQRITDDEYSIGHVEGYLAVRNLAFEKNVYVHYSLDGGKNWSDSPAAYVKTNPSDNYEVWKFKTPSSSESFGPPITYCFKYEVNGQTYWDNNNGKNYVDGAYGLSSVYVHDVKTYRNINSSNNYFATNVDVKNIDGDRVVKVRYTTDNWKTYTDVVANHNNEKTEFGISQPVPQGTKQVQFAVVYEVNGVQYWDNNFGSNYTVNF